MTRSALKLVGHHLMEQPTLPPLPWPRGYVFAKNGVFAWARREGLEALIPVSSCTIAGLYPVEPYVRLEYPPVDAWMLSEALRSSQKARTPQGGYLEVLFYQRHLHRSRYGCPCWPFFVFAKKGQVMTITPTALSAATATPTTALLSGETKLKLKCKQLDLAHGLSLVSRAVLAHSTKPILACVLLSTDQGRLRISSTNLEIGIQVWVDAQIEGEGTTALPADLLTRMVNLMPKEAMTLSVAKGSQTLHMQCAGSVSNIRGQDPREFPIIPGIEGDQQGTLCTVEAGLLKRMIEQVAFAAETNDAKPVLTAVFVQIGQGALTFAAANTFRVAERISPFPGSGESLPPVLVPARNLMELARILPSQGNVQIVVTPAQNQVVFHCEQGERIDFVSRLIAGTYPPYQRFIPKEFTTRAVIETKQLIAAVERASLFARDEFKVARVILKPSEDGSLHGTLIVEADDDDMGNHVSTVAAEVTGPERHIIFPARYLKEALERIESPQVVFSVIDSGKPSVLKPVSEVQYTCMVMSAREREKPTA